jgi:hypothetical protein
MTVTIQSQYADRVVFAPTAANPDAFLVEWETEERDPTELELLVYPEFEELHDTEGDTFKRPDGKPTSLATHLRLVMTVSHGPSPRSTMGPSVKGTQLSTINRWFRPLIVPPGGEAPTRALLSNCAAGLPANGLRMRFAARSMTVRLYAPPGSLLISNPYPLPIYASIMPVPPGSIGGVFPTFQSLLSDRCPIPKGARSFRVSTDDPENMINQRHPSGFCISKPASDVAEWTMIDSGATTWDAQAADGSGWPNYCDVECR